MGIGVDEKLMHAMKVEVDRLHGRQVAAHSISEVAERLHETYSHRSLEQIEDRLKLVLSMRGLFNCEQHAPREPNSTLLSPAAGKSPPNPSLPAAL